MQGFAPHLLTHELNSMIKNPLRNGGGASLCTLYSFRLVAAGLGAKLMKIGRAHV